MEKHDETYLSLSKDEIKDLERLCNKYSKVFNEMMNELVRLSNGTFRFVHPFGHIDFVIEKMV